MSHSMEKSTTAYQVTNQSTFNNALTKICHTLRKITSDDIYKNYFVALLFLKYVSDMPQTHLEETQSQQSRKFRTTQKKINKKHFIVPQNSSFYSLWAKRNEPGNGARIDQALQAIEQANSHQLFSRDTSIFQNICFNGSKLGNESQKDELLCHLLESFAADKLNLQPAHINDFNIVSFSYEYMLEYFANHTLIKTESHYTPPAVSELIVELLNLKPGDSISDPACGFGSLLAKCGDKIRTHYNSEDYALYGQELNWEAWSLAKTGLLLKGLNNHQVEWGNSLLDPKLLNEDENLILYDVVVSNPPFSIDKWGYDEAESDIYHRYELGVPPKTKGNYAFILHMLKSLKPNNGRMAIVVPHGVLFRGASEEKIRTQLIKKNLLDSVIGLPEKLFYGTNIPAVILIFKRNRTNQHILFIDASQEFKAGKNQNTLTEENIKKITSVYHKYCNPEEEIVLSKGSQWSKNSLKNNRETSYSLVDKYAYVTSIKEVEENEYNLNISRYVNTLEDEEEFDLNEVKKEREALKAELEALEKKKAQYLKELGYGD